MSINNHTGKEFREEIKQETVKIELENGYVETIIKTVTYHEITLDERLKYYNMANNEPRNKDLAEKYHKEVKQLYDNVLTEKNKNPPNLMYPQVIH